VIYQQQYRGQGFLCFR